MSIDRTPDESYQAFWDDVGTHFPSLKGAASTTYYFDCEKTLLQDLFPPLTGRSILKTDLWDEAKNTEILRWAAEQGARPYGVDVAHEVVQEARKVLCQFQPGFVGGDVRRMPFPDASFDLVYSMGTIEHFPDYLDAVREMYRVLKPGGTAIVGVPNKFDPFARPLMVQLMNGLGLYAYGMEKSFTASELRALLECVGFKTGQMSGILFIPGWLRILDLWCHTRARWLTPLTGALVQPFAWAYRALPIVRPHGYLLACAATRPR